MTGMRRSLALLAAPAALVLTLANGPTLGARQAITLESLLAPPFPSEIAAAPTGGRVAWIENTKGSRNVWVAAAPDFAPRQVTSYSGDDGQDITTLTWSPDGRVVLVRARRRREPPGRDPQPGAAGRAGGAGDLGGRCRRRRRRPRRLAQGSSPAVSSAGEVAYLSRGQVWSVDLAGEGKPAQLFTIRGQARDLRWSPDGSAPRVCQRPRRSQLHRRLRTGREVAALSRSEHRSRRQSVLVAGRHAHRVHADPGDRRELHVRAAPRSAAVVDSRRRRGHRPRRARSGKRRPAGQRVPGCHRGPAAAWAEGDRLVFPWERDGWIHLYAVPAAGGTRDAAHARRASKSSTSRSHRIGARWSTARIRDDIDRRHSGGGGRRRVAAAWRSPAAGRGMDAGADRRRARWRCSARTASMPAHAAVLTAAKARSR